jgi:ketosteroid isomerase-like protein
MSQDDIDTVRLALVARRSDFERLFHPDVRLDLSERVFNPDVYEGYDGIMRWRAEVAEIWASYDSEPEELLQGTDAIVVLTHERGRGRRSGVTVDRLTALLCRLRDGRVYEIRLYNDRRRALSEAGLGWAED